MPKPEIRHYQDVVSRFDKVARDNPEMLAGIAGLCRLADVNQRTLLRAVRAIHGTTSWRYLHEVRLTQVRDAILRSDAQTVTAIALQFGFRELGRFAGDYRARFGESPSETLHRSGKLPPPDHTDR